MATRRHHFGITSFGVNAWTAHDAGDRIINEHDEEEEATRSSTSSTGPRDVRARRRAGGCAGRHARLRPSRRQTDGVRRGARDDDHRARRHPGGGVRARRLGDLGPTGALYQAGEYAEAADRGRELVEAHPEYAGLFYNLACCESLAGRTNDAIEHLRRSVEMSERSREYAKGDSDFDPIRDEPAFKELIAS